MPPAPKMQWKLEKLISKKKTKYVLCIAYWVRLFFKEARGLEISFNPKLLSDIKKQFCLIEKSL